MLLPKKANNAGPTTSQPVPHDGTRERQPGSAVRSPLAPTSSCRRAAWCAARRSASTTCCVRRAGGRCILFARRCATCWAFRCPSTRASTRSPRVLWQDRRPMTGRGPWRTSPGRCARWCISSSTQTATSARPVRALAGRGRPRAAGRGRCGGAGAAHPLAPALAPVQPGRRPGPGAFPPNRVGAGPAASAAHAIYQDAGGPDPRPAAPQRSRCLQRAP